MTRTTITTVSCLAVARRYGSLVWHAGGEWRPPAPASHAAAFRSVTVAALVVDGKLRYTESKRGPDGIFPVKVEPVTMEDDENARTG